jgi:hypothetical protein
MRIVRGADEDVIEPENELTSHEARVMSASGEPRIVRLSATLELIDA